MARSLRDLRRKMKAIKSTRQVTKAMELVAASKMRRAVQNAQTLRRYALTAWQILERVAAVSGDLHPYLQTRPVQRVLIVLFTSDRGLCGSLNTQMARLTQQQLKALEKTPGFEGADFIAVGRKGQQFLARGGHKVIAAFNAPSNNPSFRDTLAISRIATESFLSGEYDHVTLLYPDFISAILQEATAKVLLPLSKTELRSMIDSMVPHSKMSPPSQNKTQYIFEPSEKEVLDVILPQLTEMQIYQSVLELAASEHSARMLAMRNASDNASEILGDLTLDYNRTRQSNITAELAELSASKAALAG